MPNNPRSNRSPLAAPNLAVMYRTAAEVYGGHPAFATRLGKGQYRTTSYAELYERGLELAEALIADGVAAREHLAILADNRIEWMIVDYGVQFCGAADTPRGTDVTDGEIAYILDHADVKVAFVEDLAMFDRVRALKPELPKLERIVVMDLEAGAPEGGEALAALLARGRELRASGSRQAEQRIDGISDDDLFTLIYTSGTTGAPKGVQLMHRNMMAQVRELPFDISTGDRMLAILPIWHSYERVFEMISIGGGACTYYTSVRTIAEDLADVRPTFMASAPRLWETLHGRVLSKLSKAPAARQKLFAAAMYCSRRRMNAWFGLTGQREELEPRTGGRKLADTVSCCAQLAVFALPAAALDAIVLKKARAALGGAFRGTVSGGGALPPHVDEFFNALGIPVYEGYGMTETAPVLAVRVPEKRVIGTVGPFYPGTEIRIVDLESGRVLFPDPQSPHGGRGLKGEIHARGPQVMKGYYKDPERTGAVLRDGWMNTGDIGLVTFNDCLKIVGRSKDTVVLSNGENVEPGPIEAKLCESDYVDQCLVVGQDQRRLGVLVVPSLASFETDGRPFDSLAAAAADAGVQKTIADEIKRLVCAENGFKDFERLAAFRLVPKAFEVGDEMTNTYKLKRQVITDKYGDLVAGMFGGDD